MLLWGLLPTVDRTAASHFRPGACSAPNVPWRRIAAVIWQRADVAELKQRRSNMACWDSEPAAGRRRAEPG